MLQHQRNEIKSRFSQYVDRVLEIPSPGFGMPQPQLLYEQAVALDIPGDILEIGSAQGRSSAALGFAAKETGRKVYCVDPADRREWRVNIQRIGLEGTCLSFQTYSIAFYKWASKRGLRFAFVFVDGLHDFLNASCDIAWAAKLIKQGGIIACHDYGLQRYPGIRWAVKKNLLDSRHFTVLSDRDAGSLIVVKATPRNVSTFSFGHELQGWRWFLSAYLRSHFGSAKLEPANHDAMREVLFL